MSTLLNSDYNFERNPRRLQELKMRPIADKIYRLTLGDEIEIKRVEREDAYLLDKEFGIDVTITMYSGMVLTGQEKFLSHNYAKYRSVTIEYMQNPITGERGDWFKLAPMFYFVGYMTESGGGFYPWVLVNWPAIVLATGKGKVIWLENANKDGHARASFRYTIMDKIPSDCIIASNLTKDTGQLSLLR